MCECKKLLSDQEINNEYIRIDIQISLHEVDTNLQWLITVFSAQLLHIGSVWIKDTLIWKLDWYF